MRRWLKCTNKNEAEYELDKGDYFNIQFYNHKNVMIGFIFAESKWTWPSCEHQKKCESRLLRIVH